MMSEGYICVQPVISCWLRKGAKIIWVCMSKQTWSFLLFSSFSSSCISRYRRNNNKSCNNWNSNPASHRDVLPLPLDLPHHLVYPTNPLVHHDHLPHPALTPTLHLALHLVPHLVPVHHQLIFIHAHQVWSHHLREMYPRIIHSIHLHRDKEIGTANARPSICILCQDFARSFTHLTWLPTYAHLRKTEDSHHDCCKVYSK